MTIKFSLGPLARNLFATASVQIIVAFLSLISGPLQARGLGPAGRGQLAVVLVIGQFAAFLVDGGALGYIIRERAHGTKSGALIGSALPIVFCSLALWAVAAWPLAHLFGKGDPTLTTLILMQIALLPFAACTQLGSGIALGEERWRYMITVRLTAAIVPVLGLAILFFSGHINVQTACICYFSATVISALPAIVLCFKSRPFSVDRTTVKDMWRFGRASLLTVLVTMSNARADVLIVAQFLSLRDTGLYAVASTMAGIPLMLANATGQSFSRRLSRNNLGQETAHASRLLLAIMIVFCAGIAAVSPIVLPLLFGPKFSDAVPVLWVLLLGTLCASPSNFLGYATSLAGQPKNAAFAQFVGVTVMAAAMIALVHVSGLIGAAVGSSLGFAASALFLIRNAHRTSGIAWHDYIIPRRRDIMGVAGLLKRK